MQVLLFCISTTLVVAAWSRGMILPLGGSGLGFDSRSGPFFFFVPFLFVRLRDETSAIDSTNFFVTTCNIKSPLTA